MAFILNKWTEILNPAPWTARTLCRCSSDGTYMYMCGGADSTGARLNDVWRTEDGITWTQLTEHAEWTARAAHGFLYFDGYFWVFGGSTASGYLNDVWRSSDCVTWTQITAAASWIARHEFAACVHNEEMYISGGFGFVVPTFKSDVWKSTNGSTWTQVCAKIDAGLNGPREHVMISFLGDLWIYGGDVASPATTTDNRMYRSTNNGVTWSYLGDAAWSARKEHQIILDNEEGAMAIIGGNTGGGFASALNDVWQSLDGSNFTEIAQVTSFTARSDFGLISHGFRCYIIAGVDTLNNVLGNVWQSPIQPAIDFVGVPRRGKGPLDVSFTSEFII